MFRKYLHFLMQTLKKQWKPAKKKFHFKNDCLIKKKKITLNLNTENFSLFFFLQYIICCVIKRVMLRSFTQQPEQPTALNRCLMNRHLKRRRRRNGSFTVHISVFFYLCIKINRINRSANTVTAHTVALGHSMDKNLFFSFSRV